MLKGKGVSILRVGRNTPGMTAMNISAGETSLRRSPLRHASSISPYMMRVWLLRSCRISETTGSSA